jgi:hypothetical protein
VLISPADKRPAARDRDHNGVRRLGRQSAPAASDTCVADGTSI